MLSLKSSKVLTLSEGFLKKKKSPFSRVFLKSLSLLIPFDFKKPFKAVSGELTLGPLISKDFFSISFEILSI